VKHPTVVSYIRVSTVRQGASGLGLEGQRAAVDAYCKAHGVTVVREFMEVESGRNNDRAVLREAIAFAKRSHCRLLIAKLDRLARNVAFIANLMDSDVDFIACDLPEATRLLLHVMAAVAEAEAKAISDRTITALAAAKARGTSLGAMNPASRNLTREGVLKGSAAGAAAMADIARDFYSDVEPMIRRLRAERLSLAAIAKRLNDEGYLLRSGKAWTSVQVGRILGRA